MTWGQILFISTCQAKQCHHYSKYFFRRSRWRRKHSLTFLFIQIICAHELNEMGGLLSAVCPVISLLCVFLFHVTLQTWHPGGVMTRDFQHDYLDNYSVYKTNMLYSQGASVCVCVRVCNLVTEKLMVGSVSAISQEASAQLLSLLRIHGKHGNAVYKGGQ